MVALFGLMGILLGCIAVYIREGEWSLVMVFTLLEILCVLAILSLEGVL